MFSKYKYRFLAKISSSIPRRRHGRDWHSYHYRWVNGIPLRDTQPAIETNWFELTITRSSDDQVIYQNAWISDYLIGADNVVELVNPGRARWKTENENHNILKTKGYHFEHNFGYGE